MADTVNANRTHVTHGATRLATVDVTSYSVELRGEEGLIGDHATNSAFRAMLDRWRKVLRKHGDDPFGDIASADISKKSLDASLKGGHPEAAGALHAAIEEFSGELALVITQLLKVKSWKGIERLMIGGGFRDTRVGELAIGRASVMLKERDIGIEIETIRHAPDEAGLVGVVHLVPSWVFKGFDAVLGVDIGGSNIRAGVVVLNFKRASDLSKAKLEKYDLWRHADDEPKRDEAVARLARMLDKLVDHADRKGIKLAPFIGVGCPGLIEADGSIARGAQNLPGNWTKESFNLPAELHAAIPAIGKHETTVLLHNDAVVQGLSERPFMQDVERWGILTIGTGLGNASFINRIRADAED